MDTLKVRSHIKGVGRAKEFVQNFCRGHDIPPDLGNAFCVNLDEFLSNIIPAATSPRICLTIAREEGDGVPDRPRRLLFTSTHTGPRYDISDENHPIWPEEEVKAKFSPLTLHRLHQFLDLIECRYENGENTVILGKNF